MDEGIIRKYAPRVFRALHKGGFTLPDSEYFTIPEYQRQRDQILNNSKLDEPTRLVLHRATDMKHLSDWREFQSTCRRLDPFFTETLKLMFGAVKGINFEWLLRNGWCIIVNLYPGGVFLQEHQRLLGTIIINEIVRARERMAGYTVPYYLYIDEVGHYATKLIADTLDYFRHFHLRLTIAHQGFSQIEDLNVRAAIRRSAKNKVMFYSGREDIDMMIRDMNYGGQLPREQVAYTLGSTAKREAVCRIGKQPPVLTRLKDWPDSPVSDAQLKSFILHLYKSNPLLYRPKEDVQREITNRFASTTIRKPQVSSNIKLKADATPRPKKDDAARPRTGTQDDGNTNVEADAAGPSEADFAAALDERRKGRKR